jgi:hypothetical protein
VKRPTLSEAKAFFYQNASFVMDDYQDMCEDYGEFFAGRYIIEILIDYKMNNGEKTVNG